MLVLESTGDKTFKMILDLLKTLWKSSVITVDQMKRVSMEFRELRIKSSKISSCLYAVKWLKRII